MMKRIMGIAVILILILALAGMVYAQRLVQVFSWEQVTALDSGLPIPSDEMVTYVVYAGASEDTMTERARTNETRIPTSELKLKKSDVWLGLVTVTDKRIGSEMARMNVTPTKMAVNLKIIQEVHDILEEVKERK